MSEGWTWRQAQTECDCGQQKREGRLCCRDCWAALGAGDPVLQNRLMQRKDRNDLLTLERFCKGRGEL